MRKAFLTVALIALASTTPAFAQKPPADQQIEAAQTAMFQSEAQFFSLAAQRLQKQISEMTAEMAATKKYWDEYTGGKPATSKPPE